MPLIYMRVLLVYLALGVAPALHVPLTRRAFSAVVLTTSQSLQIFPRLDDPMNQRDKSVSEYSTKKRKAKDSAPPPPSAAAAAGASPPPPFAPVKFLVPAMRISYEIDSLAHFTSNGSMSSLGLPPPSSFPLLLDSRTSISTLRRAFDTYTGALQFGESYTLNIESGKRKEMIRNDALPSVKQTITADLDLRDLYRNDILTCVQDLRAELDYEQRSDVVDEKELRALVERLRNSMTNWLLPISEEDRKVAFEIVKAARSDMTS